VCISTPRQDQKTNEVKEKKRLLKPVAVIFPTQSTHPFLYSKTIPLKNMKNDNAPRLYISLVQEKRPQENVLVECK
jgi:hypothetical protein